MRSLRPARPGLCSDPGNGYAFVVRNAAQIDLGRVAREVTAPVAIVQVGGFAIAVVTEIGLRRIGDIGIDISDFDSVSIGNAPSGEVVVIHVEDGDVEDVGEVGEVAQRRAVVPSGCYAWRPGAEKVGVVARALVAELRARERAVKAKRKAEQAPLVRVTVKPIRDA